MKKITLICLLIFGFLTGWLILPIASNLFEVLTKLGVQFVCCENTTTIAKASLVLSYFIISVTCLFLSYLVTKNYSLSFSCSIGIGVFTSIILSFYAHDTPFNLWLQTPFIEATVTAICIPILTAAWLSHHSSGTPNGAT